MTRIGFTILLSLLLLMAYSTFAQSKIVGHIPGAEGFSLRYTYPEDFVSNKKNILFETKVDKNGNFIIQLDFEKTLFGTFELPYYSIDFILEPDKDYDIRFDTVHIHYIIRPFYQKEKLSYTLQNSQEFLETKLRKLEQIYSDFIINNFDPLYHRHQLNLLDSLNSILMNRFREEDNFFLKQWIKYKIADTKLQLNYSYKGSIDSFKQNLYKQEILYSSPAYMTYFKDFFKDYFIHNHYFSDRDLHSCINIKPNLKALEDSIGKDSILKNERIRELATLLNLKELYNNKQFSKEGILLIINQIRQSKFKEHQQIANNLLLELPKLNIGQRAPNFVLASVKNIRDSILLQNFKGKPTYIIFYISHNPNCVRQLDSLSLLYQKHQEQINFLAISLDEEYSTAQELYSIKKYPFPMCWNAWDWEMIDNYKLKTFPTYISLDKESNIIQYPEYEVDEINFDLLPE